MVDKKRLLVDHYEQCFAEHGDGHKGVDWPDQSDAMTRYGVMLDLIRRPKESSSLLDLGCGAGALLAEIRLRDLNIDYTGIDLGESFVNFNRDKFPGEKFECRDVLSEGLPQAFDYIVMNGLFTEKLSLSFDEMWCFFAEVIEVCAQNCNHGLGFNLMSKNVDWERDDLFHVSLDHLMSFLAEKVSRDVIIRSDYGLYEYTTYVYFN